MGGCRGSSPQNRGIGKHELQQALRLRTHACAGEVDRKGIGQALQLRAVRLANTHCHVYDEWLPGKRCEPWNWKVLEKVRVWVVCT